MAPSVPTSPPTEIRAGDTVRFTYQHPDFPAADGWAMSYTLQGASKAAVSGSVSGEVFDFTVPAATSKNLIAGKYSYTITATLSGARYTAATGVVSVLPDLVAGTAGAHQSQDEKELAFLNSEILARAASDHTEYTIGDRALKREPLAELIAWRDRLRARIARRRRGGGLGTVAVHFPTRTVGT